MRSARSVQQELAGKQVITVVILDLDNTLFDWVEIWYQSFRAMLEKLVRTSGVDRETLLQDFKVVFTQHGTSEYAFALEELACLQAKHRREEIPTLYAAAIDAYRSARKRALRLFPGVEETLRRLRSSGCLLVGYTESMACYSHFRMRALGLDGRLDYLYSPPDHDLPPGVTPYAPWMTDFVVDPSLCRTVQRHTPRGEVKPNPKILLEIVQDVGAPPYEVLYVGDSLLKDISMANDAKVANAWAKYGIGSGRAEYELLRRVTHWPDSSVEQEQQMTAEQVKPDIVLSHSLAEVLSAFQFESYDSRRPGRCLGRRH
jgi:phosphoglycolate phosphatase-like HAD superfamily hydrolase